MNNIEITEVFNADGDTVFSARLRLQVIRIISSEELSTQGDPQAIRELVRDSMSSEIASAMLDWVQQNYPTTLRNRFMSMLAARLKEAV